MAPHVVWFVLTAATVPPLCLAARPLVWWRRRRQALRTPGAFACKARARMRWGRTWEEFPSAVAVGWWVGGKLALHEGRRLHSTRLLAVAAADTVVPLSRVAVRGLGDRPRSLLLITTEARLVEVVVAGDDVDLLTGPLTPRHPVRRR
jgi:hypothetical protein